MKYLFIMVLLSAAAFPLQGQSLPEWFIPLREAIYEQQLSADEIVPLFNNTKNRANSLSGAERYVMLSRCEYMMGRAYQFEERKSEAASHYSEGINYAQRALDLQESAEGWQMLAENISQSCAVRPASYAMANGLKVDNYAKKALSIDNKNAAAMIMIAARWVYAPAPFHNYKKGIEMMSVIPNESNMHKDDQFNVYAALSYAYAQQKNITQAKTWAQKALEIYPTNKFADSLLKGI
jgi:tetratricopeptide (TPR) repeat protein